MIEVSARAGSSGSYQAYRDVGYTLSSASTAPCTSVALSPSPASPQAPGTTVLWTASASGCSSAQYLFWILQAGTWSIVQDWSTSPIYSWNTTGLPAADYVIEVSARAGSSGSYQAYRDVGYSLR